MIKTLNMLKNQGNPLNLKKTVHEKPMANITLHSERLNASPQDQEQSKNALSSPHLFNTAPETLARGRREEEDIKGMSTGKEEVKLHISTGNMTLYVGSPKKPTKTL